MESNSPGRPLTYREKKRQRTISLTNTAWEQLQHQASAIDVSVSEWIEQSARKLEVTDIPIYPRIISILGPNATLLWSLAEFTRRTAVQLGHLPEPSIDKTDVKSIERYIDFIGVYITKALKIVLLMNCAFGELEVRHLTPFLCLIIYRLMPPQIVSEVPVTAKIDESEIDRSIKLIYRALESLQSLSPQYYQILQLRFVGGLDWAQISKFKSFNDRKLYTSDSIRTEIKNAIALLRRHLHANYKAVENLPTKPHPDFGHDRAVEYYQLCAKSRLSDEDREKLEGLLLSACTDTKLNFWLREIDHWAGHQLLNSRDESREENRTEYSICINGTLNEKIALEINLNTANDRTKFQTDLERFDRQISTCVTADRIRTLLLAEIERESGIPDLVTNLDFLPLLKVKV